MTRDAKLAFKRTGDAAHKAFGHREHQLERFSLLNGRLIQLEPSSASTLYEVHKLGRAFQGCIVVGQTSGGIAVPAHPKAVESAGYDPETHFGVFFSASFTGYVAVWVF